MSFKIENDVNESLIIANVQGETNIKDLTSMVNEIIILAKQVGCFHILTILSEAELEVSTVEYYDLPKAVTKIKNNGLHASKYKRAFVGRRDQKLLHFYETVSVNAGFHIKLFYDIEEAKEWLRSDGDLKQDEK